ncbi:MAG TPA: protein kinase, partial [Polyangiaceae bacterium]|nr:protein kinase [Polyangiaceae bacterium]
FGVAKATGRCTVTREGQLKGKLPYMAPEQLRGEDVTRRSDIWSASVVAWELLVGQRLFDGLTEPHIWSQVLSRRIQAPGKLVPSIPAELDAAILRGLQRAPEARFATAREMALALESAVQPATAAEVGLWVAQLAGSALASRAERIAEFERSQPSLEATMPLPEAAPLEVTTLLGSTMALEEPPRSKRRLWPWIVGPAAAGLLFAARAATREPAPLELGRAFDPSWGAVAIMTPAPEPATSSPKPTAAPKARASKARTAPPKPTTRDERCYTLDDEGVWRIKPECL